MSAVVWVMLEIDATDAEAREQVDRALDDGTLQLAIANGGVGPVVLNVEVADHAPDLLAALRDAQALLASHPVTVDAETRAAVLASIDTALAKARGGQ